MTKTFRDLGVDGHLCDALEAKGIVHPFPIQELTLPLALDRHDLIGQARTGTGKTLAFGLPLLQQIDPSEQVTQALVVVPTRELCVQVHDDLSIGEAKGIRTISVYGGVGYDEQNEALTTGVHVVVGTPGRLIDHLNRGNLDLSQVKVLVLDEADEMLDMGFLPDVERLIEACATDGRHTMLFSATMPTAIVKMARRYLDHPTFTRADSEEHETAPNVEQHFFSVHRMDKPRVLARILQSPGRGRCYVFVRTKNMADRLVTELEALEVNAIAIHGDLRQQTREKNLDRFREGKADVLVATEVAARGLDVTGVTHVVNYDCPDDEKMYLHRIGRTARAGEAGVAVTFAEFNETDRMNVIRKAVGATETEVEQVFSTSPRLQELFDLPEETPWAHLSRKGRGDSGRGDERRSRPQGRSDGRSKNRRGSEGGTGRDRGASSRRSGSTTEDAKTTDAKTTDAKTTDVPRQDDRSSGSRSSRTSGSRTSDRRSESEDEQPQDSSAGRVRTRKRVRTDTDEASRGGRDRGGRDRGERSDTGRDERNRGERDRDERDRGDQSGSRRGSEGGSSSGRVRARGGQRARSSAGGSSGADVGTDEGGSGRRGSQGEAGAGGERKRSGGSPSRNRRRSETAGSDERGSGRSQSGSGRSSGDRGGSGRSSGERSSSGRSSGDRGGSGGSGRSAGDRRGRGGGKGRAPEERERQDPTVRTERRGRAARGEGDPQLARRVRVEHLP